MRYLCGVFLQQLYINLVVIERNVGRRLVVNGGDELAAAHTREYSLKLVSHCFLAELHAHLVKVTEERHVRLFVKVERNVNSCLSLEREHSVSSHRGVPVESHRDISVGINKHGNAVLMYHRDDLFIKRREEFVNQSLRYHRIVVVAHILRKAHEVKAEF